MLNAFFSVPVAAKCRLQFSFTWRCIQYSQQGKHSLTICHGLVQSALEEGQALEHLKYMDNVIVWGNTEAELFEKGRKLKEGET